MRRVLALVVMFCGLFSATGARAGYEESQTWFTGLTPEQRSQVQTDLILLGYFSYLVDGAFGQATFTSLTGFQRSLGRPITGVLLPADMTRLNTEATAVLHRFGVERISDAPARMELALPAGLLTEKTVAEMGTTYATPDGGIRLETIRRQASEQGFRVLYDGMSRDAAGRTIAYASYNDDRFVVGGSDRGRQFYTMFQNADPEQVGYTISWTTPYDDDARVLAIYLASNAQPLASLPQTVEEQKSDNAVALQQFGAFSLPPDQPSVIMLNDEITGSTDDEFWRALEARPNAEYLILNSPGGYVDTALVIAYEVKRRGMTTLVPSNRGCYSACAYIFFAGSPRVVEGELGVHQIYTEVADLVFAQTTLGDILDALHQFGVEQDIVSHMLRTPPAEMYVFTVTEIVEWHINIGGPVRMADLSTDVPVVITNPPPINTPTIDSPLNPNGGLAAFVHLAQFASEADAARSANTAREKWAGVLGESLPEVERYVGPGQKTLFRVRVPARSIESANAMCAAIKSSGGGCYVTKI